MTNLGLYIHIPFCRSRCDYCGFYSIGRKPTDRYMDALTKEMDLKSPDFEDRLCDTVYLGGGSSGAQRKILRKAYSTHSVSSILFRACADENMQGVIHGASPSHKITA